MRRVLLVLSGTILAYTYALFPALLLLRGAVRPRPHRTAPIQPPVTVVIAAYDEALVIGDRIRNLLACDYPADRLEIIVASDGSTDGTNDVVRAFGDRVRLLALPRAGKNRALTAAVEASTGEILVFTDANTEYRPDAIRTLVRNFADPEVGGVAGNQVYLPPDGAAPDSAGERGYWDIDRMLKRAQSRSDSVVGATGAIYAIRRDLFRPIPHGVADDLSITFGVLAAHARFVFEEDAVALEPVAPTYDAEFARKVRVVTKGLQCVAAWRQLLDPRRYGFLALVVLSRKVLMRTMALPLAVLLATSVSLAPTSRLARLVALPQVVAYLLAAIGLLAPGHRLGRSKLAAIPAYVVMAQAASVVGLWKVARGDRQEGWQTARSAGADPASPSPPSSPAPAPALSPARAPAPVPAAETTGGLEDAPASNVA